MATSHQKDGLILALHILWTTLEIRRKGLLAGVDRTQFKSLRYRTGIENGGDSVFRPRKGTARGIACILAAGTIDVGIAFFYYPTIFFSFIVFWFQRRERRLFSARGDQTRRTRHFRLLAKFFKDNFRRETAR